MEKASVVHVAVEFWQMMAGIVVYTGGIVTIILWLNRRFAELLTVREYMQEHSKLEDRVASGELRISRLEIWRARMGGRMHPRDEENGS